MCVCVCVVPRRLYTLASPAQLDEGFARQAQINYLEMLGEPLPRSSMETATLAERIGMQVRGHCHCVRTARLSLSLPRLRGVAQTCVCICTRVFPHSPYALCRVLSTDVDATCVEVDDP